MSKKNIIKSFIINITFLLLVILFCDMKYEVSDDYIVDAVLSGAFGGGYDAHLLFSNIIYGYFLKFLYTYTSGISWYFVCQIIWCFLALWAITFVLLEHNQNRMGMILSLLTVSILSDDLYILVQFTKTASVLLFAGGVLFLHGIWSEKRRKLPMIFGGFLFLVGSLIRFWCIYYCLAFLLLAFLRMAYKRRKEETVQKQLIGNFLACILLVAGAFCLYAADAAIWNHTDGYRDYRILNATRADVTDVQSHEYETIKAQVQAMGLDETDQKMFESWNFLDRSIYDDDTLHAYAEIKKDAHGEYMKSLYHVLAAIWHRKYVTYTIVIGIAMLLILMACTEPKKLLWLLPDAVLVILLLLYLIFRGHAMYRVEYSIFLCFAVNTALWFDTGGEMFDKKKNNRLLLAGILLMCLKVPLYIPDTSYKTMTDEQYSQYIEDLMFRSYDFDIQKYRCDISHRRPQAALIETMETDTEHYYLLDFSSAIQRLYLNYKPWERIEQGYFEKYCSYLGGVTFGYPTNDTCWEKQGMDAENPYASLTNDNIYVVDNRQYETKLQYMRKYYNPDIRQEEVATVDGFRIWKYTDR